MLDNNVHTVIDYNGVFSHVDDFKHSVPLLIKGNDPSLSEIAIALSMARDSEYRMPKDLRVFLSSWDNPHSIDLTGIISLHYISHLRALFPTRLALVNALKEHATALVSYHSDSTPADSDIEEYLNALWHSIPPTDTSPDLPLRLMGNGSKGEEFALAHWFSLPHVIVAIPPVPLLTSAVGDSIRRLSGDIVIEVTSGLPAFWNHKNRSSSPNPHYTCGAFRLSADIAKQNPLNDELEHIRKDIKKIIDTQTQHENRLNEHDSKLLKLEERLNVNDTTIQKHEDRLNGHDTTIQTHENRLNGHDTNIQRHENRFNGHDSEIATIELEVGKLKQWKDDSRTLIEVKNNAGDKTILIDGEAGDITLL
jgi:hypothetical protein